jgi:ribosomal protein L37AE/L43A
MAKAVKSKKTTYACEKCDSQQTVPADYMGTPSCKKCKKAMKEVKVVDTSTEIKRTNRMYLRLAAVGQCDAQGKTVLELGFRGKIIAPPDAPLTLLQNVVNEMLSLIDYSSKEAAEADIAALKEFVNGLKWTDDKAGSDQGTGTDLPNG